MIVLSQVCIVFSAGSFSSQFKMLVFFDGPDVFYGVMCTRQSQKSILDHDSAVKCSFDFCGLATCLLCCFPLVITPAYFCLLVNECVDHLVTVIED